MRLKRIAGLVSLSWVMARPAAARSGSRLTSSLIRRSCFSASNSWRNSRRFLKALMIYPLRAKDGRCSAERAVEVVGESRKVGRAGAESDVAIRPNEHKGVVIVPVHRDGHARAAYHIFDRHCARGEQVVAVRREARLRQPI